MVLPIGMSVIYRLTPPDRRGAVMAMYGVPVMVAPAVGPVLSGWLLQFAEWWFVFIINVPIGAAALLVGLRVLPSLPPARATLGRPDTLGVVLGPLAFASLSYGISQSAHAGWSGASTLGGVAVGLVALGLFVWRELSVGEPLLELRVFRRRDFALTIVTQWAGFASMFGTFFLVPLFLQQVRGYGSFQTGLFTFPQAVAVALFMPIGGRLFDGFGARAPVVAGMTMAAAAMGLLSGLTGATTGDDLRAPLVLMGGGMGLIVMSLNTHLLNSAPRELVGRVTSLSSALQNVVGSLGIAGAATILQSRLPVRLDEAARAAGGQPAPRGAPRCGRLRIRRRVPGGDVHAGRRVASGLDTPPPADRDVVPPSRRTHSAARDGTGAGRRRPRANRVRR